MTTGMRNTTVKWTPEAAHSELNNGFYQEDIIFVLPFLMIILIQIQILQTIYWN